MKEDGGTDKASPRTPIVENIMTRITKWAAAAVLVAAGLVGTASTADAQVRYFPHTGFNNPYSPGGILNYGAWNSYYSPFNYGSYYGYGYPAFGGYYGYGGYYGSGYGGYGYGWNGYRHHHGRRW